MSCDSFVVHIICPSYTLPFRKDGPEDVLTECLILIFTLSKKACLSNRINNSRTLKKTYEQDWVN